MLVLGIETTCDETACSVVRDGTDILSNVISSQIDLHAAFGGVVPELACRRHVDVLIPIIEEALSQAGSTLSEIDLIAVSQGPGLIGALLIGINAAKSLSLALNKPFVGVNHVEAHLYAAQMGRKNIDFPALGVVLSGGHTSIYLMENPLSFVIVAETVDDAIGEAFDKVAKLMQLPYPGGPIIEKLAFQGDPNRYSFKAGHVKEQPHNFSFSGLKTAVLYAIQGKTLSNEEQCHVAASFQQAAFNDVIAKISAAAQKHGAASILFGGGVTNSQTLRKMVAEKASHLNTFWPIDGLSLDNAAMIAGLGYHIYRRQGSAPLDLDAFTRSK